MSAHADNLVTAVRSMLSHLTTVEAYQRGDERFLSKLRMHYLELVLALVRYDHPTFDDNEALAFIGGTEYFVDEPQHSLAADLKARRDRKHTGLSTQQIDSMLSDCGTLESLLTDDCGQARVALARDVCCHVKALAAEEEKLRSVANMAQAWMAAETGSNDEQTAMSLLAECLEYAGYKQ